MTATPIAYPEDLLVTDNENNQQPPNVATSDMPDPPPQHEYVESSSPRRSKKRIKMFCFHCNRPEGHFVAYKGTWLYSFVMGMTFGLVKVVGPYKCQCCGKNRLMSSNFISPAYHIRMMKDRQAAGSSSSGSRRRRKKRS